MGVVVTHVCEARIDVELPKGRVVSRAFKPHPRKVSVARDRSSVTCKLDAKPVTGKSARDDQPTDHRSARGRTPVVSEPAREPGRSSVEHETADQLTTVTSNEGITSLNGFPDLLSELAGCPHVSAEFVLPHGGIVQQLLDLGPITCQRLVDEQRSHEGGVSVLETASDSRRRTSTSRLSGCSGTVCSTHASEPVGRWRSRVRLRPHRSIPIR